MDFESKNIRWKQRFQNLEKAFDFFEKAVELPSYSDLEAAGLVQSFEFTFELSMKTLKDYLESLGKISNFPREVLKEAFESGILEDGHAWIHMLEKRNELSHTYNHDTVVKAVEIIKHTYYPAIEQLIYYLRKHN